MQEAARGCGARKVGGKYLVCDPDGFWDTCDRIPYELTTCKACGHGVHLPRTPQEIIPAEELGNHDPLEDCDCWQKKVYHCPMCLPDSDPGYLMTVGAGFYTPESFLTEAKKMGISKRIHQIPRHLEMGKTWVYLGHPNACGKDRPGIFLVFQPQRIEQLVWKSEAEKYRAELEEKGIKMVLIEDGDTDHMPAVAGAKHYHLSLAGVPIWINVYHTQALAQAALQERIAELRHEGDHFPGNLKDGYQNAKTGARYEVIKCIDPAHMEVE